MKHLLILPIFTILAWLPGITSAQSSEYAIHSFHADLTVHEEGLLTVRETIETEYFVEKHGIIRDIPFRYNRDPDTDVIHDVRVISVFDDSGEEIMYDVTKGFQDVSLKIGSPYITITGPQTYVITYEVSAPFLYFEDHDELFWNVTGTAWDVPIEQSSATVHLPEGVEGTDSTCYTGEADSEEQACTSSLSDEGIISFSSAGLLTIVAGFTPDVIQEISPELIDLKAQRDASEQAYAAYLAQRKEDAKQAWWFSVIPILSTLLAFMGWVLWGKEAESTPTIIAQYEPPDNLRPAEIGTLMDGKVHPRDLSASLIDLAVRGHIQIQESKDKKSFTLIRLKKKPDTTLHVWEKDLLNYSFGTLSKISSSSLSYRLGNAQYKIRKSIRTQLKQYGYYKSTIGANKVFYFTIGIILLFASIPLGVFVEEELHTILPLALLVGSALPFLLLAPFMNAKTAKGVQAFAHAKGFKLFLKTAEQHRIQWQEKEGIFEQYLPYAMAFGVVDKWSKALADLYRERAKTSPAHSWYVSSGSQLFDPLAFAAKMKVFSRSSSPRVASSGSSSSYRGPSSSGFSGGGGRSGGGFGGGGGRSW